jgi:ATP-dependent exoDNAse (exonuclease V) alpha subunit
MVVVAPTGVAAINASGVTIHSFFQLSFGPLLPDYQTVNLMNQEKRLSANRFSREKINIIKSLDLLIIDEISMVRADLLDGIDSTLRRFRNKNLPFGGVQLLMIGDLQQLAPIVKGEEERLLRQYYDTPFFFSSIALKQTHYISIELQHVYRQKDQNFINLLNKIRDNKIDNDVINKLNARYKPEFDPDNEGYIILTTHNAKAKQINDSKLNRLQEKIHSFEAEVSKNFPEYAYPTNYDLELKVGAQVMFVKNDPNPAKLFYNGKIGTVIDIDNDIIAVDCEGDDQAIEVVPVEWQKMKYTLDKETKEINETIDGTFTQYPLKLAWAVTIHKAQGLTFEKAIIDAEASFAHGQVYVALSRCKSLEGLVLKTPISAQSVKHDKTVEGFTKDYEENQPGKIE